MSTSVRNGIRAGTIFAVIIIFLALIGFLVTGSNLIGKVLGNAASANQMPPVFNEILFLAILGICAGAAAAKPGEHDDRLSKAVIAGLSAGALIGLLVSFVAAILGYVLSLGYDLRAYLAKLSPDVIRLFLFNMPASTGVLIHFGLYLVSSLLGALLSYALRHMTWHKNLSARFAKLTSNVTRVTIIEQFRRSPYAIYFVYALVAVVLFFLPRTWGSYWNYIIGTVGIYIIMGLGLNIIVGLAGQLVLGYVAFFAIGAYSMALLTAPQPHALGWSFWPALLVGVLLAAFTGILLGLPILRLRGDYLAIVTLGFGEIIRIMLRSDILTGLTAGPRGVRGIVGPDLFGRSFTSDVDFMYLIILGVLLIIFITNRLQNSRAGRAWVAIREDEIAARASGINTVKSKLLALAIGAAYAGLGGALFASRNQFTGPEDHAFMVSVNVLSLVIVGGMGSIPGVILGAFALKGLPEILRELDDYRLMVFGALLVLMMIWRPDGLWPASRPRLEGKAEAVSDVPERVQTPEVSEGVKHAS